MLADKKAAVAQEMEGGVRSGEFAPLEIAYFAIATKQTVRRTLWMMLFSHILGGYGSLLGPQERGIAAIS